MVENSEPTGQGYEVDVDRTSSKKCMSHPAEVQSGGGGISPYRMVTSLCPARVTPDFHAKSSVDRSQLWTFIGPKIARLTWRLLSARCGPYICTMYLVRCYLPALSIFKRGEVVDILQTFQKLHYTSYCFEVPTSLTCRRAIRPIS